VALTDSFNRPIDYLRISVTDRCNFRCVYCMPEAGASVAPREDLLTFEEIERLTVIASGLGVSKIRLTGGEPLVRRDITSLVRMIGRLPGIRDLSMTTNGFLLTRYAAEMAEHGLRRVNISLDTLRADRFAHIARRGRLEDVLAGIDAALAAGLSPIKLNCVVMRGWNDDEVVDFAQMTAERPFDIRFIELMPIHWSDGSDSLTASPLGAFFPAGRISGNGRALKLFANPELPSFRSTFRLEPLRPAGERLDAAAMRRAFVPTAETRARIEERFGRIEPADVVANGPARSFRVPGAVGTVSFISQLTRDLCARCNRLRLTADGQLRPCLMADGEVDLRSALRSGVDDEGIACLFRLAVLHKPREHRLAEGLAPSCRTMSQIGG
jgi:cyclic pyranopterin phosphate synthase